MQGATLTQVDGDVVDRALPIDVARAWVRRISRHSPVLRFVHEVLVDLSLES